MRHADAGYDIAKQCAKEQGLKLPMVVIGARTDPKTPRCAGFFISQPAAIHDLVPRTPSSSARQVDVCVDVAEMQTHSTRTEADFDDVRCSRA
jgi:hypothetical protein